MCGICGCSDHEHEHEHEHEHAHHHHHHDHAPGAGDPGRRIELEARVMQRNDATAAHNRGWFEGRGVLALNLVSSPGAGKTTLLERTLRECGDKMRFWVVEGDQQTDRDAARLRDTGAPVLQINTGTGCHLDADMIHGAMHRLDPKTGGVVMIENVGNLVCPALFDLGERAKVVVASVTEGEDKPLKYPHMFRASRLMLLNKIDLLPHLEFDVDECIAHARTVNPDIEVLKVSTKSGDGLDEWYAWLAARQGELTG